MLPFSIDIALSKDSKLCHVANLSINSQKELFFRILWRKRNKPTKLNDFVENRHQDVDTIDHVSFHRDGTIHIAYRRKSKTEHLLHNKIINIYEMPQSQFIPLIVFSIYNVDEMINNIGTKHLSGISRDSKNSVTFRSDLKSQKKYTFAIFLIGAEVDHTTFIQNNYPGLFYLSDGVILNIFGDGSKVISNSSDEVTKCNDYGIVVAQTDKVLDRSSYSLSEKLNKLEVRHQQMMCFNICPNDNTLKCLH